MMADLCVKALDAGIETRYVQELIRKRNLAPILFRWNATAGRGGSKSLPWADLRSS